MPGFGHTGLLTGFSQNVQVLLRHCSLSLSLSISVTVRKLEKVKCPIYRREEIMSVKKWDFAYLASINRQNEITMYVMVMTGENKFSQGFWIIFSNIS